ncbi:sigma-54-dependent transcriptional regulator [Thalassoglobus polymorphus]|uniref:DNA-binding transcriptional regulator NtrC n=1 Tax=Thalassoglobus polymorphus TaxID=2527994 RepID=A0A517QNJ6_9PLAN|nr:sigma-54 dependent transcriptional regulator [Thalassoglobus polymorphus]QDT33211.1 Nitrogen assimilation regulatory protein [Thalassoglobus polymorphus]
MSSILIVDDEPSICWALKKALSEDGHQVNTTATAENAIQLITESVPDVVVMDVRLPGMDGLSALQELQRQIGKTPVIIITAFGDLDTAVQAINRGAFEYLTKPFDLDQAIHVIQKAIATGSSVTSADKTRSNEPLENHLLIGSSPAMQAIYRDIAIVAERDVPVLITGESGTGKELVAGAIHRYSKRAAGPFVPVCIPAMSESVLESELFGHTRGAFTGATEKRSGLIKAADGGTAFFDEIGDITIPTQVKLLRVIESRAITPVGGDDPLLSDFRLLAATNRDLDSMVADGTFRKDLYFRLNVYQIMIPPLRDRPEDIPLLADHFMKRIDPAGKVYLGKAASKELLSRPWLGNVRELRNTIEHAVIVTRSGEISADAFAAPMSITDSINKPASSLGQSVRTWIQSQIDDQTSDGEIVNLFDRFLSESESVLITEALSLTHGNRQEAAKILGIHRQTLREKIRRYQVNVSELS